jgi:NAD(P)-dependent dehydrogenase (short-subunit alcohol dehydrogenase family)
MADVLIIGATGGIGAALMAAHLARGDRVTGLSRADGLDLMNPGPTMARLSGPFDRVIIATGILAPEGRGPEKALGQIDAAAMAAVMAVNAIGPALVLAQVGRLMARDRAGVVAALSARVGSIGDNRLGGWHSYRASKAALNQIVRGAAVELGRTHRQVAVVALHPGTVATPFGAAQRGNHAAMEPAAAAGHLIAVMDGLTPADTGSFRDWQGAQVPW